MASTQVSIRVDEETLKEAKKVLGELNISVSTYLQLMLKKVAVDQGFTVSTTPTLPTVEADAEQQAMLPALKVASTIESK